MAAPQWFSDSVSWVPVERDIEVLGTSIHLKSWGEPELPGVVLVHGGAAHAGWWDHIAPFLARRHRVVALDLSGHGDSGSREGYGFEFWSAEVLAVVEASEFVRPPVLIGHSMGGWVSMAAATDDARVAGVAVLDTPLRSLSPEQAAARDKRAFGPLKVYPTLIDAISHFRTVPDQADSLPFVMDHVARRSLREVDGGWSWKFDPRIFGSARPTPELLQSVRCRAALFRAERGLVTTDVAAEMYALFGRTAPVVEIPLAGHHIMLDQPLPLVSGLLTLLADWDHSVAQIGSAEHL
ncbi:alpha/beta hydrolase [Rhodococcus sp. G-MC3]|uniref:alpha/beta fold hydrolase n=1 Tax=Rhodococcus sp. G-MC3 TaxID=3046209 RepID=UPI0024B8A19A|nr:alpha/beta hydrolase [Rhodococcus sp. G-MC3]MDJ0394634.1 alpha/beta hydrolase [Rhodococcus sp. G-MC3]